MLVRVIQITARQARWGNRVKFLEKVAWDLCASQRFVDLWDSDMVIAGLRILYWKPGFQEKSLVVASLMSNNCDISKIHFVVVFVDMAGDLRVVFKHENSPVMFHNPSFKWSFSLAVVYKTAVGATDFVHWARLWPVNPFLGFRWREQIVQSS